MRDLHAGDLNSTLDTQGLVIMVGVCAVSESAQSLAIQEDLKRVWLVLNGQVEADLLLEGECSLTLLVAPATALAAVSHYLFFAEAWIEVEEYIAVVGEEIHAEVSLGHSVHVDSLARFQVSIVEVSLERVVEVSPTPMHALQGHISLDLQVIHSGYILTMLEIRQVFLIGGYLVFVLVHADANVKWLTLLERVRMTLFLSPFTAVK